MIRLVRGDKEKNKTDINPWGGCAPNEEAEFEMIETKLPKKFKRGDKI